MEYFLLQNLGYDGIVVTKYSSLLEAESAFSKCLEGIKDWDTKYPNYPSDKGLVVIEGKVVLSDHPEELF